MSFIRKGSTILDAATRETIKQFSSINKAKKYSSESLKGQVTVEPHKLTSKHIPNNQPFTKS